MDDFEEDYKIEKIIDVIINITIYISFFFLNEKFNSSKYLNIKFLKYKF